MNATGSGIYRVELLSKSKIELDNDTILASLQKRFGNVESMSKSGDTESLMYAFPDYLIEFSDATIPAQAIILSGENQAIEQENYTPALQQTWDWNDAQTIVPACQAGVMLSDFMAAGLPYKRRLQLFNGLLLSLLSVVSCDAIHWVESQKICNPAKFSSELQADDPNILSGALNVRMFNVQGGAPTEVLMDTRGLSVFGLPDIQCHFVQLNPSTIANLLFRIGYYIFERGDVIEDGEKVEGPTPSDSWRCQHEMALVGPEREILDINPGAPYAAGNRE